MKESNVKDALKKLLKNAGAYQFWPVQMGRGAATIDCLICYKGKFYGVETKRPEVEIPTPRQACVMREIAEAGGGVCLENSMNCEATRDMLGL